MNIYRVTNVTVIGYDTYDSMIVAANTPVEARQIHPSCSDIRVEGDNWVEDCWNGTQPIYDTGCWVPYSQIGSLVVDLLGAAEGQEVGALLTSFNAG